MIYTHVVDEELEGASEPSQSGFGDCSFKRTRVDEAARWSYGTKLSGRRPRGLKICPRKGWAGSVP